MVILLKNHGATLKNIRKTGNVTAASAVPATRVTADAFLPPTSYIAAIVVTIDAGGIASWRHTTRRTIGSIAGPPDM